MVKLFSVFLSPVTQQLSVYWTRFVLYTSVIPATAALFCQFGESTAGVMLGWGFPQGEEPGGLKGGDFQTHRCCWILVSRQEVWAHGSELFILWTQPVCLCLTRLLQAWSAMFDAAATSQRLNKAELLQRWATLACPMQARVLNKKIHQYGHSILLTFICLIKLKVSLLQCACKKSETKLQNLTIFCSRKTSIIITKILVPCDQGEGLG